MASQQVQAWHAELSQLERAGVDIDSAEVDEEERRFWQAARMHPDLRQVLAQASEFPASSWEDRYDREGLGNPVLHVLVHATVKAMAQEDPECGAAFCRLVERAQSYQASEDASQHAGEHAVAMIFTEYLWRGSRESPKEALQWFHAALRRCAKWKGVTGPIVEQIRTPLRHDL